MQRWLAVGFVWFFFAALFQFPPHNVLSLIVSGAPAALFALGTMPRTGIIGRLLFAFLAVLEVQINLWRWAPTASPGLILLLTAIGVACAWVWAVRISRPPEAQSFSGTDWAAADAEGWRPAADGIGWINANAPRTPRTVEIIPPTRDWAQTG